MNLKLEDLSHYIVLLIFILIIIKVLGAGFYLKVIELMSGHKKSDDFELDDLISKKKSQMVFQHLSPSSDTGTLSLNLKLERSSHPQKEELKEFLKQIQWGEYKESYTGKSKLLLKDISYTNGLPIILEYFFDKTFQKENLETLDIWSKLAEKSILWTNLLGQTKANTSIGKISKLSSLRSLALLKYNDQEKASSLSEENLKALLEEFHQPLNIEKLDFSGSNFLDVEAEEIFQLWEKNANIFKSLEPNVPISIETNKNSENEP
jgi:hypothetical protein